MKPFFPKSNRCINFLVYIASFLVSLLGILLILKSCGFYPFKNTTLLVSDMKTQYLPFFASLRYANGSDNSLFFSWSRSMGGNYIGLFAYYIASPLSFITLLFPLEKLPLAITIISVLKISLCGLTFSIYANYLWTKYSGPGFAVDNSAHKWTKLLIIPFAVSYALMSYNITYLLCIMWIDGVIFLPLILLGVEKILSQKRIRLYTLALAALFVSNYYTGYMIGLFTAIYMLFCILTRYPGLKESLAALKKFTLGTFCALGLSAPVLLPVIRDLFSGKLAQTSHTQPETYCFQPFSLLLAQYKNGSYKSLTNAGMPSIYCGYIILIFVILFFCLRKISVKEKIGAFFILTLLSASFYFTKLDLVWHGFQAPNFFPYRYSFLFSFTLLYMAIRAACTLPLYKLPNIWKRRPVFELLLVCLMFVTAADLGINGRTTLKYIGEGFIYDSRELYQDFLRSTKPLVDSIKENDSDLYRINQGYEYTKNDSMLLGYHGLTHYSSTYNLAVNNLTSNLGLAQHHFWNSGYGSTPLLDSLFGVKYILEDQPVPKVYQKLQETDFVWNENMQHTASYLNRNALPIAYCAPVSTLTPVVDSTNPFTNQNQFMNAIMGDNATYFEEIDFIAEQLQPGWRYTFTATSANPVYLYIATEQYSYVGSDVLVIGNPVGKYFTAETSCNLYLGSFTPGEPVVVEIPKQTKIPKEVTIAELQMELVEPALETLHTGGIQITEHNGGFIAGTVTAPDNSVLITSIPYDTGWTVQIDNQQIETGKFADTFLALPINEGEHTISFSYCSPGFKEGIILFCFTIVICAAVFFHQKRGLNT